MGEYVTFKRDSTAAGLWRDERRRLHQIVSGPETRPGIVYCIARAYGPNGEGRDGTNPRLYYGRVFSETPDELGFLRISKRHFDSIQNGKLQQG